MADTNTSIADPIASNQAAFDAFAAIVAIEDEIGQDFDVAASRAYRLADDAEEAAFAAVLAYPVRTLAEMQAKAIFMLARLTEGRDLGNDEIRIMLRSFLPGTTMHS